MPQLWLKWSDWKAYYRRDRFLAENENQVTLYFHCFCFPNWINLSSLLPDALCDHSRELRWKGRTVRELKKLFKTSVTLSSEWLWPTSIRLSNWRIVCLASGVRFRAVTWTPSRARCQTSALSASLYWLTPNSSSQLHFVIHLIFF